MPNSGMLDHVGYRPVTPGRKVHWMDPWPNKIGYQSPRTFKISDFSRHMIRQTKREVSWLISSCNLYQRIILIHANLVVAVCNEGAQTDSSLHAGCLN